jgi:hypothetical protein
MRCQGRQKLYRTNAEAIRPLHEWAVTFERHWQHQLSEGTSGSDACYLSEAIWTDADYLLRKHRFDRMSAAHLHPHLNSRSQPIDNRHQAIESEPAKVRVANAGKISCRNPRTVVRGADTRALNFFISFELCSRGHHDWPVMAIWRKPSRAGGPSEGQPGFA